MLTGVPAHAQDVPEPLEPPPHISAFPDLATGQTPAMRDLSLSLGPEMERGRSAREMLRDRRRLDEALDSLEPHRPGRIDAFVIAIALDSDPVFAREAREAGNVLSRRYDAEGRTLVLAGPDGREAGLPRGSIESLTVALAHMAEIMDPAEDVLVLYTTSHGTPQGLAYQYGDTGFGLLSPERLRSIFTELGLQRRILLLSACFSGVFVPHLASADTAIITAAAHDRTSFGCQATNDWTFFGDALVNRAMRKPLRLSDAAQEARISVAGWELENMLQPSLPQVEIGTGVLGWLPQLEARMPQDATEPVGRPATGFQTAGG